MSENKMKSESLGYIEDSVQDSQSITADWFTASGSNQRRKTT